MADTGFRSLADQLRSWSDEQVSRLLHARADLATPTPHDSGQLASRAATRSSVLRALDQLTRLELSVLDALVVAGQTSPEELRGLVAADPDAVDAAVEHLRDLAVAWEATQGLRALTGVAEGLAGGPGTSGLRPRTGEPRPPAEIEAAIDALSPEARALLQHVAEHGGEATTSGSRHTASVDDARTPAEELIARRLLVPAAGGRGGQSVILPGEVGLVLRGGHTTIDPVDDLPALATSSRSAALVDRAAAGAAFEAVRRVELVLEEWSVRPPTVLRSGGLGVRDLKAVATLLQDDETAAALWVELAFAARLLATGANPDGELCWLPTDRFDTWSGLSLAERWSELVRAWLDSDRLPGLVGSRDTAGKAWNALQPELTGVHQVEARRMTLSALAELPAGEVLAAATGLPSLVAQVAWRRPRRPRTRADQIGWAVREAAALGVTGLDGLASYARPLLDGDADAATAALAALLPAPVDHVLLQADLTAVAPGPLESVLARRLQTVAEVESRGGATTYRFTPASVRRAFDTGWSAVEVHDFLGAVSRTPVPQPLSYLVDDTARTHGSVRVGHAEAFLRSDDETALTAILHHPQAASLGLRRLAPTVLISDTPIDLLLPRLRELGAAPVVEAPDGTVHVARPDVLRARTPKEARAEGLRTAREAARISAVVTALRAGDRAAADRPTAPAGAPLTPSTALAMLREALQSGESVVITYVGDDGVRTERVVDPHTVEGGRLLARDHRSDDVRAFAVHRIVGVRPLGASVG